MVQLKQITKFYLAIFLSHLSYLQFLVSKTLS
jgi:hypothetical protein